MTCITTLILLEFTLTLFLSQGEHWVKQSDYYSLQSLSLRLKGGFSRENINENIESQYLSWR